jgi:hypothetical protein
MFSACLSFSFNEIEMVLKEIKYNNKNIVFFLLLTMPIIHLRSEADYNNFLAQNMGQSYVIDFFATWC